MQNCKGCREQQTIETLCLTCTEDLNFYLREIPVLYSELSSVRLPGSIARNGPWTSSRSLSASPSPVRLEVVDLLDRGETLTRLREWTDERTTDVALICDAFRHHLLATVTESWAGDFFRAMRALCRDLGRAVGQPEERPVGKCSRPVDADELCRGQLMRSSSGTAYCRRCGDKPDITVQPVWITAREAALITGKPIETVRTWIKRGRAGYRPTYVKDRWSEPIGPATPNKIWLPTALLLATVPQSGSVNHGLGAEPSVDPPSGKRLGSYGEHGAGRDASVGPSVDAHSAGTPVASDPSQSPGGPADHLRAGLDR